MPVESEASPPAVPEANEAPTSPSAEEPSTEEPRPDLPLAPSEPEPSSPSESPANDGNDDAENELPAGEPPPAEPAPEEPVPPEEPAPEQPTPEEPAGEPPTEGPVVEEPPAGEGEGPDDGAPDEGGGPGAPPDPVTPPDPVEPPSNPCLSLQFGGSCYEIFPGPATWDAAEQQCVAWGGHLASIGTAEEDAFLDAWPARLGISGIDGSNLWLGATDAALDGDFRWSDGSPFAFSGFAAGQPDNGPGVNCVVKRNDGTQLWYDLGCTDQSRFVCERGL